MEADGAFSVLRVPDYPKLWASGWLWSLTRWMSVFLCSYLVNERTGSPLLVQLVGTAFFAPMFFGGIAGGVISDRFDRRHTIMRQLSVLAPVALLMAFLVNSARLHVWMVYPFMLVLGAGGVLDMTSRRALVFDMVGARRVTQAMTLESMAQTSGTMFGTIAGGAIIELAGAGNTFLVVAAAYAVSWAMLAWMRPVPRDGGTTVPGDLRRDIAEGFRYVRGNQTISAILGVTVLMNFFYFSHMPLVPVFAKQLHVNAFGAGVLASAAGLGSLIATFVLTTQVPYRLSRGMAYTCGSLVGAAMLMPFALSPWYALSLGSLMLAGAGQAGFGSMQGALILLHSTPEMRGRAMGVLSMGIGALPFGTVLLGLVAQATNPRSAVFGSALLGLTTILLWVRSHRQVLRA